MKTIYVIICDNHLTIGAFANEADAIKSLEISFRGVPLKEKTRQMRRYRIDAVEFHEKAEHL